MTHTKTTLIIEKIYEATVKEIYIKWIHRAGIAGIAKKAGMSASNIYNHFSSKDDLLNKVYIRIKSQEAHATFADYPEFADIQERFYHIYRSMFHFYSIHQEYYNFTQQTFLIKVITAESTSKAFKDFAILRALLIEGQKTGIFFQGDPSLQMIMIGWILSSVMKYSILETLQLSQEEKDYVLLSMREVVKK